MVKKTSEQNPVDEAYLRSLMAGSPPERVTPSVPQKGETDRETAEETKTEFEAEEMPEKAASKTLKAALAEFMRRFLTPYKCEGRQGVYIDKELHQKISVIVGIAGKRQLTVGNYIDNVAVLFWLLFAYLFMDKFLFRGQLGEICFGKARCRMAKALRSAAGWFDPVKEERKKGRGRAKGKTGRKETPAVVKTQEKELPPVKAEMKPMEKTAEKNSEQTVEKQPETDSLVVTRSYGTRQQPPMNASGSGAIAGTENASTFAGGNEKTSPRRSAQVQPERIPDLFQDKRVEEWRASGGDSSAGHESDDGETGNGDGVDTDELNEELEDLNCAREDYSEAPGIGPEEIDLIIDLCNGKDIPAGRRLSLLKAIHHIKDTRIERSILESINGSDSRISKFLDDAERMGGAAPDSD